MKAGWTSMRRLFMRTAAPLMRYYVLAPVARPSNRPVWLLLLSSLAGPLAMLCLPTLATAQTVATELDGFTKKHCASCHNNVDREGGLDLTALSYAPLD